MLAMNNINPDLKILGASFKRGHFAVALSQADTLLRYLLWRDVDGTNLLAPRLLATEF